MKFLLTFCFVMTGLICFGQGAKKITFHSGTRNLLRFTPNNDFLAIANGKQIQLYNSGTDTRINEITGRIGSYSACHSKPIADLDFTSEGEMMVTGGKDGSLKLWKIPAGEVIQTISPDNGAIHGVRFVQDRKYVCFVSASGIFSLWEISLDSLIYARKDIKGSVRAFDVSQDGKWAAIGGADKLIFIYDISTGKLAKQLEGHSNWVRALAFSPNSKTLASAGDDKKLILWDLETGKTEREILQDGWTYDLEFSGDGKYVAAGSERFALNFYNSSNGSIALKLKEFKGGVTGFSISPNGKEVATTEDFSPYVSLHNIEALNITPALRFKDNKDRTAPLLMVSNPPNIIDNRATIYKDMIDLKGIVTDESGVRSLRINRLEIPVHENGNFLVHIPLAIGETLVSIEATDVNDNIALKKFILTRKNMDGQAEYDALEAKNYLLIIGINNYRHWPKLSNAVKDVDDLVGVLTNRYGFQFDNITLLKDEEATRVNVHNNLRKMIEKVTARDNLVVYFSGHGYFDQGINEGYWIPVEANTNSTGEYFSNTEVLKIIGNINSQHTFLIADACFSGALFSDTKRSYADNIEKFKSRWALASGRLETVSDGAAGTNSPFAQKILQFLTTTQKEKFAISELIQYVKIEVAEVSEQTPIGNPLRVLGDEGGEMVFYKKQ